MAPIRGCSAGSTTMVRLVPIASGLPGQSPATATFGVAAPQASDSASAASDGLTARIIDESPQHRGRSAAVGGSNMTLPAEVSSVVPPIILNFYVVQV